MDRAHFEHLLRRSVSRRRLLGAGLGLIAVSLSGRPTRPLAAPRARATAPVFGTNPFTLGVASGDPLPDGVVLWTRLAPDPLNGGGMEPVPVEVRWEVAADDAFSRIVQTGVATASPNLAHSVHVDVRGLEPGRPYVYRFLAGNEVSPVGRTRTAAALAAPPDRLRFAVASCAHWEHGSFAAYRHLAAEDLDLVVFLGDYLYDAAASEGSLPDDGAPVRRHPEGAAVTLEDYRTRHALYKTDPDLQAAHAAVPWVATWDDHEVENNYAADRSETGDPPDRFLAKRAAAYQAYYEHMPLRPESMPQGPDLRLYRRLTYGDLAEFSALDTRQYRTDQPCGAGAQPRCAAALDPNATMLGPEQERWLLAGLDASTARWNVIAQQVMMAELDTQLGPGEKFATDIWDGYPAARNRILGHIMSRGIANPVVLTGDIHSTWVNDLKADFLEPDSTVVATEFVAPSITAFNPYARQLPFLLLGNPHVKYFDARHGYVRCELTADRWQTDICALETVADPAAPVATIASFVVEAGRPGAVPA